MTEQNATPTAAKRPIGVLTRSGKFVGNSTLEGYAVKQGVSRATTDEFEHFYNKGLVEPLYNPLVLARHLELNTYHAKAVFTKARDVAGMGWEVLPVEKDASDAEKQRIEEMLESCNEMPLQEVLYRFMVDLEATGYSDLELGRDDFATDGPYNLINHIPSHTIRVHKDKEKYAQVRGNRVVWFKKVGLEKDIDAESGQEFELGELPKENRANELVFRSYYTPRSDFYGLPDHIPALGAMAGDVARRDYNIAFFDNYGVPSMMVFVTGDYDPGEPDPNTGLTPLEETIQSHFSNLSQNPYSSLIMAIPSVNTGMPGGTSSEVKVTVEPLSMEVKDASFRLFRQDNRDEVLSAHGVPRYRMGISETGALSGNFAQESTEIYKASVVGPRQKIIEDIINLIILPSMGVVGWRFALTFIDMRDEKAEVEEAKELFTMGALTPNDLIRHFGDKYGVEAYDHPAMDAHYIADTPIDLEVQAEPEVTAALESLKDRLLTVAAKQSGGNGNGHEFAEIVNVANEIRDTAGSTAKRHSSYMPGRES